jgi:predicted alpha/beta superfamily hydrolase
MVAQTFRVQVFVPVRRTDGAERFPVVYATDGNDFFGGLAALSTSLQVHGETPRFILVGIGYEGALAADMLRLRDFHTHQVRRHFQFEIEQFAASPLAWEKPDLAVITQTSDARDYLRFICDELMHFIDAHYPTCPGDNTYWGYSAGGGFGLHTLFTRPSAFRRYIIGSPTTSHRGHHFGIEQAEAFAQSGGSMCTEVFISVGELEEFNRGLGDFDLVTGYYRIVKYLRQKQIPGLSLTHRSFSGETHATAWTLAFTHGLIALFGPALSAPFQPAYFKQPSDCDE